MKKGMILAADDTGESLRLLTQVLNKEGYLVHPASSGELALASARANPPELILLDIHMAGMNGFDVCRRLKIQPETRNVPVVFLSATTDIEERVEGLRLGAVDFVSKPFRTEELLARVETHLELGRLRANLEKVVNERTMKLQVVTEMISIPVKQAIESQDWSLVLRLFEPTAFVMLLWEEESREWLLNLPQAAIDAEPGLAFWRSYVLLGFGRVGAAEAIAEQADIQCERSDRSRDQWRIRSVRAKAAELRGDGPSAVSLAGEGLELAARLGFEERPLGYLWLGSAYCMSGQPMRGEEMFRTACSMCERLEGSRRWLTPVCYSWYGRSLYLQGRLNDALAVCRQSFSLERQYGGPTVAISYMLEADILIGRNLLDVAQQSLEKALDVNGSLDQWFSQPNSWLTAAVFRYARGDVRQGDHVVDDLVEWARRNNAPAVKEKAEAIRVNYWLKEGQIERAWLWSIERKLTAENDFAYAQEPTYLALARLYAHRGANTGDASLLDRAISLLGRLRRSAETDGRMGHALSALIVETLAIAQSGRLDDALASLERCLTMAIPESAFRAFLDEGPMMFDLLQTAAARGVLRETTTGLSAMFQSPLASARPSGAFGYRPSPSQPQSAKSSLDLDRTLQLINPLTDREFELLNLIAAGLTNASLADSLFISNNTVKTHVKHLYQKLNASTRTEAVARARSLGLLAN
ncbi:hypothetical protein CCAX7_004510 [Capsulimonas corticalis]|uniref:Uncharacterized protein n=1 Tax=Capsulimonas corticalis TaxID=2219043 RepID=A0A402D2Y1_9BACT|nr:response regulator [Capsulimonas corticalis]BDI28400.1 hypothetical protein CCAX7_004510 [Capsulimonas corticalis]